MVSRSIAPSDARRHGHFKAGLFVADIGAFKRHLEALNVDADGRTFVDRNLNVHSFVFRDPEGNRIQAFQRCDDACSEPARAAT